MSDTVTITKGVQPVRLVELDELYRSLSPAELVPFKDHSYLTAPALARVLSDHSAISALCCPWPAGEVIPAWVAESIHQVALSVGPHNPVVRLCVWQALLSRLVNRPLRSQSHHHLVELKVKHLGVKAVVKPARGGLLWSALRAADPEVSALVTSLADGLPSMGLINGRLPHLYRSIIDPLDGVSWLQLPSSAGGVARVCTDATGGEDPGVWLKRQVLQSESDAPAPSQAAPVALSVAPALSPMSSHGLSAQARLARSGCSSVLLQRGLILDPVNVPQLLRSGRQVLSDLPCPHGQLCCPCASVPSHAAACSKALRADRRRRSRSL